MRYGILGDIHGNRHALEAVLEALDRDGVDRVVSVGDVVGYGAAPAECIQMLRDVDAVVVKGNHDAACTGELNDCFFNPHAQAAVRWTQTRLTAEDLEWLRGLPLTATLEHCHVAHGTYADPELFNYVLTTQDADPSLDLMRRRVCFVGHTHVPVSMLRLVDDPLRTGNTYDSEVDLSDTHRALINVGSVGQPRDEDSRTGYTLYDSERQRAWMRRLPYDIEAEATRIRLAGLPAVLAERLFLGL